MPPASLIHLAFAELGDWAAQWLQADRVLVHPKAVRAASRSVFQDPPLVYRLLHALSEHYWPMCMLGDKAAAARWTEFLAWERLDCQPTGEAAQSRRRRGAYSVQVGGQSFPLDMHGKGSSSRKEQLGLRVYFHASKTLRRILIGHLPSHLNSRAS